jgi:hypothetical protein
MNKILVPKSWWCDYFSPGSPVPKNPGILFITICKHNYKRSISRGGLHSLPYKMSKKEPFEGAFEFFLIWVVAETF